MSAPNPGDVLPLWNPEIPGEEIQAGRLGIRIRPGSPAAEKVKALEAFGGAERLREMLEELKQIDGTYQVTKPEKPLEFIGQVSTTVSDTSPRRSGVPSLFLSSLIATRAKSSGVTIDWI